MHQKEEQYHLLAFVAGQLQLPFPGLVENFNA